MRFKDYVREQIEVIRDRDPAMKDDFFILVSGQSGSTVKLIDYTNRESSTRLGKYRSAPRERPV